MAAASQALTPMPWTYEAEGIRHEVHVVGDGAAKPALLLMHELPGMTPQCLDLARRLEAQGFVVYLPLLLGKPGKRATWMNIGRLCVGWEFTQFCQRAGFPVTRWLRALGRELSARHGDRPIGVIGMCLTGGFVLSLVADRHVLAAVSCQPAYPLPIGGLERALGVTWHDMHHAARNSRCRVLGLRFEHDAASPPERFAFLAALLGPRFRAITLRSDTPWIERNAHAVLTEAYRDWPDHPTRQAFDEVVAFLHTQLG